MAFVFEHVKESEADKVLSLYPFSGGNPRFVPGQPITRPAVMWSLTFPAMRCSVCGIRKPARWPESFPSIRIRRWRA